MKATANDLRINSKGLLDAVSKGEEVVITFRGKPCAKLMPYEQTDKPADMDNKNDLFGCRMGRAVAKPIKYNRRYNND